MNKISLIILLFLVSCSSIERKVKSIKEATDDNTLESGIYNNKDGENLQVTVINIKDRVELLEKQEQDYNREIDYLKNQNQKLEKQNLIIKVSNGYKVEEPKITILKFDHENNPVIKEETVNLEPPKKEKVKEEMVNLEPPKKKEVREEIVNLEPPKKKEVKEEPPKKKEVKEEPKKEEIANLEPKKEEL